jgi:hypothetical protein
MYLYGRVVSLSYKQLEGGVASSEWRVVCSTEKVINMVLKLQNIDM